MYETSLLEDCILSANTGLDAIKRAPIVEEDTGIKCLRIQDISQSKPFSEWGFTSVTLQNFEKFKLKKDEILIARTGGSIGVNRFISDNLHSVFNNGLIRLRVDTKNYYPKYIYYTLQTSSFRKHIDSIAFGTAAQPNMKIGDLLRYEIPNIPLTAQITIANIIDSLDFKIDSNININKTLEEMAQAIFKSWFVDFDPVKAKAQVIAQGGSEQDANLAAMQIISGKTRDQLAALEHTHPEQYTQLHTTASLFPSAFVDSELGEIPEGWEGCPTLNFGSIVCGKTPSKSSAEYYGADIPFIKIPDMHGNAVLINTGEYLSIKGSDSQRKKLIPRGSICVSCIATVGLVSITTENSHTNQQINSIVPNKNYYTIFLYFTFKNLYKHLHDLASGGSATLNMNTGTFSKIAVLKPVEELIAYFHNLASPLFSQIEIQARQIKKLGEIRDNLLPKLLSGEIDVSQLNLDD